MNIGQKILITVLIVLGFFVRLYKINNPIADWHSHRQADTASVTRNFVNNGINILKPTYHDLSNVQSGQDNPSGWRMVEAPIYNTFSAATYNLVHIIFPQVSLEIVSRLISIILSLLTAVFIFLIVYRLTKEKRN